MVKLISAVGLVLLLLVTTAANQSANTTRTLAVDTTWLGDWIDTNKPGDVSGNGALTIETAGEGAAATGTLSANQSGASTPTLPTIRYQDLSGKPSIPTAPGNGSLTIQTAGEGASATGSFTANQGTNSTVDCLLFVGRMSLADLLFLQQLIMDRLTLMVVMV